MTRPPEAPRGDLTGLLDRARALAVTGSRRMLGITGSPGTGKSTLAEQLVAGLPGVSVLVPMDGFHLAQVQLRRLDRTARKGAMDTFDVDGFVHLLRRLRQADEEVVYAPTFRRDIEEPVAGAVAVARECPLVVIEGNYLLVDEGAWHEVRPLLDEVWFLEPDDDVRLARLTDRHVAYGRTREEAERRSGGSDQVNADVVAATRQRADLVVTG